MLGDAHLSEPRRWVHQPLPDSRFWMGPHSVPSPFTAAGELSHLCRELQWDVCLAEPMKQVTSLCLIADPEGGPIPAPTRFTAAEGLLCLWRVVLGGCNCLGHWENLWLKFLASFPTKPRCPHLEYSAGPFGPENHADYRAHVRLVANLCLEHQSTLEGLDGCSGDRFW